MCGYEWVIRYLLRLVHEEDGVRIGESTRDKGSGWKEGPAVSQDGDMSGPT